MQQVYDLHAHTTASDGELTPSELVAYAKQCGVDVLAVTDHDVTNGLEEAMSAANESGVRLIPGIEISVTWSFQTIHVVGLHIDPSNPVLQTGLGKLREFRIRRAEEIAQRLQKAGISDALEGAKAYAKGDVIARTHFARFLVEAGHAENMKQVFKRYLVRNKPGYVPGEWAELEEAVNWIRSAAGIAVIAHPARYQLSASRLRHLLAGFRDCGGVGIEVVCSSHNTSDIQRFTDLADYFGLYASRGSDYHGPENIYSDPKRLPELPEICRPVWTHSDWYAAMR
jgi:predicted metal-dependent phosphoesterase TrpH